MASLGGDRDRTVPGAARGAVIVHDVAVERAAGLVHRERRDPLHLRPRRDHHDLDALAPRASCAAASATPTESGSLGSTITSCARRRLDRLEDLAGARPPARAAVDHDGAGLAEQLVQARPGGDDHQRAAVGARARLPRARSSCSAKWVTSIRRGAPARMPASTAAPTSSTCTWTFHSPSPPTTTSESPSGPSSCAQRRDGVVVGVEQVHHLVRRPALGQVTGRDPRDRDRGRARRVACRRGALAGDGGLGRVEHHAEPTTAGVDDAGVAPGCGSCSGVRARASRAALGGGAHDVAEPVVGDRRRRLAAASDGGPGDARGWCPRRACRRRRRRPRWPAPSPRRTRPRSGRRDRPADPPAAARRSAG